MTLAFKQLLNNSTQFRTVIGKARELQMVQQRLLSVAPSALAPYLQVISLEFGTLTLAANNATVAAKLRQLAPQLVADMKKRGEQVNGIRVKVQVNYIAAPRRQIARRLSGTARASLQQLGDELADSPLKNALQKIAKVGR